MSNKQNWIAGIVFVALAGIYLALRLGALTPETIETPSAYELAEAIFTADQNSFAQIRVTNPSGTFSFVKREEGWSCVEQPDIELEQPYVNSLSWDYVNLKPSRTIEQQPSDLEQYGLTHPQASIDITLTDGTEATFLLGDQVEGQNGYYMQKKGQEPVYLLSTVEGNNILNPLKHYRRVTLFSVEEDDLSKIVYQNNGQTYEILRGEQNSWKMTRPFERNVYQSSLFEQMITPIQELKIEEFYDDKTPEECGLVQPAYSLQLSGGDSPEDVLLIGQPSEQGLYYAKWENKNGVFGVSEQMISLLETDPLSYLERYVYLPHIDTVEGFSGVIGDREFSMEIKRSGEQETYYFNGEQIESSRWKEKFQCLLNAEIIGMIQEKTEGQPVISYTARRTDGSTDSVAFFPMGERYFAVSVNDRVDFYVSKNTVDAIIEKFYQ